MKRLRDYYVIACGAGLLHAAACTSGPAGVPAGDSAFGSKAESDTRYEGTAFGSTKGIEAPDIEWLAKYAREHKQSALDACRQDTSCSLEVRVDRVTWDDSVEPSEATFEAPVAVVTDIGRPTRHRAVTSFSGEKDFAALQPVFVPEPLHGQLPGGVRMAAGTDASGLTPCELDPAFDAGAAPNDYEGAGKLREVACGDLKVTFSMDLPEVVESYSHVHFPSVRDLSKSDPGPAGGAPEYRCETSFQDCYWDTNGGWMPELRLAIFSAQGENVSVALSPLLTLHKMADATLGITEKPGVVSTRGSSPFSLFSLPAALLLSWGTAGAAAGIGLVESSAGWVIVSEAVGLGTTVELLSREEYQHRQDLLSPLSSLRGRRGDMLAVFEYDKNAPESNIPVALCSLDEIVKNKGKCVLWPETRYPDAIQARLGENAIPKEGYREDYHWMLFR